MPTYAHAHVPTGGNTRGKGVEAASSPAKTYSTFAKPSDYFSEERPFVVLIGKKGVIGALQELDGLLRTVRAFSLLFSRSSLGFSQLIANLAQAGYNKIISNKVCDFDHGL